MCLGIRGVNKLQIYLNNRISSGRKTQILSVLSLEKLVAYLINPSICARFQPHDQMPAQMTTKTSRRICKILLTFKETKTKLKMKISEIQNIIIIWRDR